MIDLNSLQCIFANTAATYAIKNAAGVKCSLNLEGLYEAYNHVKIADAHINGDCDITTAALSVTLAHQNAKSLIIQTCC